MSEEQMTYGDFTGFQSERLYGHGCTQLRPL